MAEKTPSSENPKSGPLAKKPIVKPDDPRTAPRRDLPRATSATPGTSAAGGAGTGGTGAGGVGKSAAKPPSAGTGGAKPAAGGAKPAPKQPVAKEAAAKPPAANAPAANTPAAKEPAAKAPAPAGAKPATPKPAAGATPAGPGAPANGTAANGTPANGASGNRTAGNGAAVGGPAVVTPAANVPVGPALQPGQPVPASAPAAGASEALPQLPEDDFDGGSALRRWLILAPSWLVSMIVHAVVLMILAVLTLTPALVEMPEIISNAPEPSEEITEVPDEIVDSIQPLDVTEFTEAVTSSTEFTESVVEIVEDSSASMAIEMSDMADLKVFEGNMMTPGIGSGGTGISGRGDPKAKAAALAAGGGTAASEEAVARALEWLAKHQLPDGGWTFDHRMAKHPNGEDPGTLKQARNGATGLALLPFLGAGHTHKQGKYKEVVRRGLVYLTSMQKPNGAFNESGGSMYSHGICAIALCEAYAMTQDKTLKPHAQAACNFIGLAQDPVGGGWRYQPNQPGDTSAVGWQIMALKSGHLGYLAVPPKVIQGADRFLTSVAAGGGAQYGYTSPGAGPGTTAVGLLCRMNMGWKRDNPALEKGVDYLAKIGPSRTNMYFNYYATQVLHHYEGERWRVWNSKMRDFLIDTQVKSGHETGSWYFQGGHDASAGGRLYVTAMATMTLEVYYRHLPIYRQQSTEADFDN